MNFDGERELENGVTVQELADGGPSEGKEQVRRWRF